MDIFSTLYEKWRRSFIKIAFLISAVTLFLEVIMSILLVQEYPGMIKLDLVPYSILYILVPSTLNFSTAILGKLALASEKFSERAKNYISVLTLTFICFFTSCFHNVYAVLPCSLCFPVYVSIVFSDRKLTRNISILSFLFVCISTFCSSIDGRADDKFLYITLFITVDLLISSYFIARYLFKLEFEKNILLRESYLKQSELEEQLKYDPLTNLYNMSTFFNLLTMEIEKEKFPLTVAVIDVDNFKKVNDTYGHDNGNTVLIYLSQLLQAHCSAMGYVFRYGGEEFSIIFPNQTVEEVMGVMEDMRCIFAAHHFDFFGQANITFSCGIAETSQIGCKPRDLFNLADRAMYKAKADGKNRTIVFDEGRRQACFL